MTNGRIGGLLGVAGIWAGLVLALVGPGSFSTAGRAVLDHAGYAVLGCAAVVLLYNLAPKGTLTGPLLLGAVGVVLIALTGDWRISQDGWSVAGLAIALAATSVVLRRPAGSGPPAPTRRTSGLLLNRHLIYDLDAEAPERLDVTALLCRVVIDLRSAGTPRTGPLEVVVSSAAGHVDLAFPSHWPVVAGRTAASRKIRLDGFLDTAEDFDDPRSHEQAQRLSEIEAEWQARARTADRGIAVVVHVAGIGGSVRVRDR
ncbi:hypothetical protein [Actinoplanes sp. NPDC048796]|uniref:hypothetical protein n=1 Tax=unclassified Actinoplanes TaxID=2626549 RepID=UPI0033E54305